jgi:hypothetical protein
LFNIQRKITGRFCARILLQDKEEKPESAGASEDFSDEGLAYKLGVSIHRGSSHKRKLFFEPYLGAALLNFRLK